TSRQPFEDDRARYDREGRPASFYNRAPERLYRGDEPRMPASRYDEQRDRYRRTERYQDQPDRYRLDRYRDEPYGRGYREHRERTRGYNLRCRDIMSKGVTTCGPATSLRKVADMMDDEDVGSIPVVENGRLVGIVTDRDVVCRIIARELDTRSSTAADSMTEEVVTCTPDEPAIEAVHKMAEFMIRRIPVVDHGRLRGMISIADVALEAELDRELARAVEQISHPTPHKSRRYAAWR